MRLLLCDSHAVFAESLALVLGEAGYEVVAVSGTPDEAIAALRVEPVDVCVVDVGAAPQEVLDRLPELSWTAGAAHIVLLSGSVEPDLVTTALELGVRAFAYKDQRVADIIETIERVHRGEVVDPGLTRRDPAATAQSQTRRLAAHLTPREREVLCRLVSGDDTNGVAGSIGVTWATARSHIQSVLTKLGVHSRVEAAAAAVRHGLVNAETGEWSLP